MAAGSIPQMIWVLCVLAEPLHSIGLTVHVTLFPEASWSSVARHKLRIRPNEPNSEFQLRVANRMDRHMSNPRALCLVGEHRTANSRELLMAVAPGDRTLSPSSRARWFQRVRLPEAQHAADAHFKATHAAFGDSERVLVCLKAMSRFWGDAAPWPRAAAAAAALHFEEGAQQCCNASNATVLRSAMVHFEQSQVWGHRGMAEMKRAALGVPDWLHELLAKSSKMLAVAATEHSRLIQSLQLPSSAVGHSLADVDMLSFPPRRTDMNSVGMVTMADLPPATIVEDTRGGGGYYNLTNVCFSNLDGIMSSRWLVGRVEGPSFWPPPWKPRPVNRTELLQWGQVRMLEGTTFATNCWRQRKDLVNLHHFMVGWGKFYNHAVEFGGTHFDHLLFHQCPDRSHQWFDQVWGMMWQRALKNGMVSSRTTMSILPADIPTDPVCVRNLRMNLRDVALFLGNNAPGTIANWRMDWGKPSPLPPPKTCPEGSPPPGGLKQVGNCPVCCTSQLKIAHLYRTPASRVLRDVPALKALIAEYTTQELLMLTTDGSMPMEAQRRAFQQAHIYVHTAGSHTTNLIWSSGETILLEVTAARSVDSNFCINGLGWAKGMLRSSGHRGGGNFSLPIDADVHLNMTIFARDLEHAIAIACDCDEDYPPNPDSGSRYSCPSNVPEYKIP